MSEITGSEIEKLHDWQQDLVDAAVAKETGCMVVKVPRAAGKTTIAAVLAGHGAHVFIERARQGIILAKYGAPEEQVHVFDITDLRGIDLGDIHTFVFDDIKPPAQWLEAMKDRLVIYLSTPAPQPLGTLKGLTVEQDFVWDGETKTLTYGGQKFSWMPEWKLPDWATGRVFYFSTLGSPEALNKTRFDEANKNRVAGSLVGAPLNKNHKKYDLKGQNIIVDTEVSEERLEGICYVEDQELLEEYDAGNVIGCSIDYKDRNLETGDYDVEGAFGLGLAWVTSPYVLGYPDSLVWEATKVPEDMGIEPKTMSESMTDLVDKELLKQRTVFFEGYVSGYACAELAKTLEYLGSVSQEPIKVVLNSGGGSVYAGLLVFDTIKRLTDAGVEVTCEVRGLAASMGAIILQAGTYRIATPNTRFLIHEVSSWAWGKTSEMEDELAEVRKVNDLLKTIIAERVGKTADEIEAVWHKKDVWLSVEEALEFGLIDEIIEAQAPVEFKPDKTEEERTMAHNDITSEEWAELSDEEKQDLIDALSVKGSKKLTLDEDGDVYFSWLNSLELRFDGFLAKQMSATEVFKRLEKEEEEEDEDDEEEEEKTLTADEPLDLDGDDGDGEPIVPPSSKQPDDDYFAFIEDGGDAPELRHLQFRDDDGYNEVLLITAMDDLKQMTFDGEISKPASEAARHQLIEGFKALRLDIPEWASGPDGLENRVDVKHLAFLMRKRNRQAAFRDRFNPLRGGDDEGEGKRMHHLPSKFVSTRTKREVVGNRRREEK